MSFNVLNFLNKFNLKKGQPISGKFTVFIVANGHVYGVVWRFEAQACQTATKFIRCNTLEISTTRQMHYTRCYALYFLLNLI